MANNSKVIILIGGIVAIIGQFCGADYYLPLIGGAIAVIVGLLLKKLFLFFRNSSFKFILLRRKE